MPNWCDNYLELGHDDPRMIQRARNAFNTRTLLNEFVPVKEEDDCCEHWGCKWDVGEENYYSDEELADDETTDIIITFESAWAPPVEAYPKFEELGFTVLAYYYEPGCLFCGSYEDGIDTCYNIDGDGEWVVENIPTEIDERFSISETMIEFAEEDAEYEEEQQRRDEKNSLYPDKDDITN